MTYALCLSTCSAPLSTCSAPLSTWPAAAEELFGPRRDWLLWLLALPACHCLATLAGCEMCEG